MLVTNIFYFSNSVFHSSLSFGRLKLGSCSKGMKKNRNFLLSFTLLTKVVLHSIMTMLFLWLYFYPSLYFFCLLNFFFFSVLKGNLHGSVVKTLTHDPGALGSSCTGPSWFFMGVSLGKTFQSPRLKLWRNAGKI